MRPIADWKYLVIAEELRSRILDGRLAPGDPFPTLAAIGAEFDAAEETARNATNLLRDQGLIVTKPGTTSRVRDDAEITRMVRSWYRDAPGGSPWRADMAAQGRTGSWTAQSATAPASAAIAKRLRIEPGAEVMCTAYVMTVDGNPAYLSTSWEPTAITGGSPVLLPEAGPYAGAGVVDRMTAIGHTPTHSTEDPAIYYLTTAEAEKLGKRPGLPCLLIRRTYYEGDTPLETADIVLPPDDIQVSYEIPIGDG